MSTPYDHPIEAVKLEAWLHGNVAFAVPPVTTQYWRDADWIRWVDWSSRHNQGALVAADKRLTERDLRAMEAEPATLEPFNHNLVR